MQRIVVIGASAGGVETLRQVVSTLPAHLPCAVLITLHIGTNKSELPGLLSRAGALPASISRPGEWQCEAKRYAASAWRSVVTQSLKTSAPVETMRREIEGRITAIARAQSVLTGQGGVESSVEDLIEAELAPFKSSRNVVLSTDATGDVLLSSQASLSLGLALHELSTNAAKYGALSAESGRLEVSWSLKRAEQGLQLTLLWAESGGPAVSPPSRRGFGSKLIELSLEHGLGATVTREFREAGLHCVIEVPLHNDVGRWRPTSAIAQSESND